MKKYLLDTHILLWILTENPRIKPIAHILEDKSNPVYFSQISLFEVAIKQKIGKLPEINVGVLRIHQQLLEDGYDFLPIKNAHVEIYKEIPLNDKHRDPFDRLLLATAYQEEMTIITADEKFISYQNQVNILLNA